LSTKTISVNKKSRRLVMRETVTSYLFLLPFLVFFVGFVIYPMFMCVYTSFFDATMGSREDIFIGFDNYRTLFNDPVFWKGLKNTLIIVFVSVPVTCAFSLWVASAIAKMPWLPPPCSAAFSTCPWSPAPLPLPWSGSGCTTTTTASSTIWARKWA